MTTHYKRLIGDAIRAELPPLIGKWQSRHRRHLMPTAWVATNAAVTLDVSGGAVRKYLTDAVADGDLLEILVRRDWLLVPPYWRETLPLYAVPDGELYRWTKKRPASRGSNGVSFLTTPEGYDGFLDELEKEFLVDE